MQNTGLDMIRAARIRAGCRGTIQRCDCGGYHFPHRKFGGACYHSPRADYYSARQQGATIPEAQLLLSIDQLERMFPL